MSSQPATPIGVEMPVFVTLDGRARPHARWFGRLLALLLAGWIAAIAAGGTGFATLPPLPVRVAVRASVPATPAPHTTFVTLRPHTGRGRVNRS
jgi:hypothetical protein